ncbi:MAG: hypothetical protein HOY75_35760 [Streptomyces sp.]|nr:hypothetical protein [Streptomyces sp.]
MAMDANGTGPARLPLRTLGPASPGTPSPCPRKWAGYSNRTTAEERRSFVLADLEAETQAAGITATVVLKTVNVAQETGELPALAEAGDLIGAVVGWTGLTAPHVADVLEALRSLPGGGYLRGIRHQVQAEPDPTG